MVHTMTALQRRQEESRTTPKISERRAVPALQGMPRFLGVGSARQSANVIARDGTQGHGRALAHGERIQNSFGSRHDLSSVRMHVGRSSGEACDRLGAAAFATGSSIAFRADPDLWLAAHEAAHVIQQRHGEGPPAGLDSPGDRHERAASAVADRVVAGNSARDLLPRGERRAAGSTGAVQRYTIETLGGGRAQVGESKQTALFGSQTLYATSALISGANSKLQAAGKQGSSIELKAVGGSVSVDGNSLTGVQPEFLAKPGSPHSGVEKANAPGGMDTEGTANGPMALWTDCGRSSAAVTGSSGGGDRSVVYFDNDVAKLGKGVDDSTVSDWLKGEPNQMANQVYMDLMPRFIERSDNAAFVVEGVHYAILNCRQLVRCRRQTSGQVPTARPPMPMTTSSTTPIPAPCVTTPTAAARRGQPSSSPPWSLSARRHSRLPILSLPEVKGRFNAQVQQGHDQSVAAP